MNFFEIFINKLKQEEFKFIKPNLQIQIFNKIDQTFIRLNNKDKRIIKVLLIHLIDLISYKHFFDLLEKKNNYNYSHQWIMNNFLDTRACLNLILPYIDDKNNEYLYKHLVNLSQIISVYNIKKITTSDLKKSLDYFNTKFCKWSNFIVGILPHQYKDFSFFENNCHKIYHILFHNYMCVFETLQITQSKLYINWINITPISNQPALFKNTNLYLESNEKINELKNILQNDNIEQFIKWNNNYRGLWLGDIYNTCVHNFYLSIKNMKWIIYNYIFTETVEKEQRSWYGLQILNKLIDVDFIGNSKGYYNLEESVKINLEKKWLSILNKLNEDESKINGTPINLKIKDVKSNIKLEEKNVKLASKDNLDAAKAELKKEQLKLIQLIKEKSKLFDDEKTTIYGIDIRIINNLLSDITIFFLLNYSYKTQIYKLINSDNKEILNQILQNTNKDDTDDIKEDLINKIDVYDILKITKLIPFEHIFNYIFEIFDEFKSTIYSTYLINIIDEKYYKINMEFQYIDNIQEEFINLKYIYNFSKSIYHNHLDELTNFKNSDLPNNISSWDATCLYYQSLNLRQQISTLKKLFDIDNNITLLNNTVQNWFNIDTNINRIYKYAQNKTLNKLSSDDIRTSISKNIIDLVFFSLTKRGILSQFNVDYKLTDKKRLPSGYESNKSKMKLLMKNKFKENKDFGEAYYYLTNQPYKLLPKWRELKKGYKKVEKTYFEFLAEETQWYTFYAMNWITQIKFYNNFIHNKIIYNTGATGQGKSTQTPKLLLYGLKMYQYKDTGKVICTQPRIPPTLNNAERISTELGVPIKQMSFSRLEDLPNDNFYVQYKYQFDNHQKKTNAHLTLLLVTDGTLYETICSNTSLKNTLINDKKVKPTFLPTNVYDIVIIDEAHEHNTNMDMILTLAKNTLYINNSIKLIIISATMDQDEAIYRRFYKIINDNLVYPILNYIPNIESTLQDYSIMVHKRLNHNYVDRRFHISPPGASTQYKITDIYQPINFISDKLEYDLIQKKSIEVILEICNKNPTGEILLFSIGTKEILDLTKQLNQILPITDIALPYFSALHHKYKFIIEKIDKQIINIKNTKDRIHLDWGSEYKQDMSVAKGLYKRAIIIATNVAEASVTIPRLKFVVDNGYAKVNRYNSELNTSQLIIEKISESSRVQRRGRAGRLSDGFVTYLYEKGAREKIKPKYKINQEDNHMLINKLLRNGYDKAENINLELESESQILPESDDPNLWNLDNLSKPSTILSQFYLNNIQLHSSHWPEEYEWMGQNRNSILDVYFSGFDIKSTLDDKGQFYIIHPYEEKIHRNILGDIVKYNNIFTNHIDYDDLYIPITKLIYKMKIIDYNMTPRDVFLVNGPKSLKCYKTLLGNDIDDFSRKTMFTNEDSTVYLSACAYGNQTDILAVLTLIKASNQSLKNMCYQENRKVYFTEFKQVWNNKISDILVYHDIWQRLKNDFNCLFIIQLLKKPFLLDIGKNIFKKEKEKYLDFIKLNGYNVDIPTDFDVELFNNLSKLYFNGEIYDPEAFKKAYKNVTKSLIDNYILKNKQKYNTKLESWCKINYINVNTIETFLNDFYDISKKILCIVDDDKYSEENDPEENFKKMTYSVLKSIKFSPGELIIKPFLHAYSSQIAFKFKQGYSLEHSLNNNMFFTQISQIYDRRKQKDETIIPYPGNILHWLALSHFDNSLKIITNINVEWLFQVSPQIFNPVNINKYKYNNFNYDLFVQNIINSYQPSGFVWNDKKFVIINLFNNKLQQKNNLIINL